MSTQEMRERMLRDAEIRINTIEEAFREGDAPDEFSCQEEDLPELRGILSSMGVAHASGRPRQFVTLAKDLFDKTPDYGEYFMDEGSHEANEDDFENYFNPDTHGGYPDDWDEDDEGGVPREYYHNNAWDRDDDPDDYFDDSPSVGPNPIDLSGVPPESNPELNPDLNDAASEYREHRSNDQDSRMDSGMGSMRSMVDERGGLPRESRYTSRRGRGRLH